MIYNYGVMETMLRDAFTLLEEILGILLAAEIMKDMFVSCNQYIRLPGG